MTRRLIGVKETSELLDVSESYARKIMRQINENLKQQGFMTLDKPLKVPKAVLYSTFNLGTPE